jgi:hypothetical protein
MSNAAWEIEHSVEVAANPAFTWTYMTDVANWDDPPAQFKLDGPFTAGGRGTTEMPGQPPRYWQIREVKPVESYTIEFSLDRATMSFEWRFTRLQSDRTRLTQHVSLEGKNAAAYLAEVQQAFTLSLEPGMNRIAQSIDRAYLCAKGFMPPQMSPNP